MIEKRRGLGLGHFLNTASQEASQEEHKLDGVAKVQLIDIKDLKFNPKNFYGLRDIRRTQSREWERRGAAIPHPCGPSPLLGLEEAAGRRESYGDDTSVHRKDIQAVESRRDGHRPGAYCRSISHV